MSHPSLNIIECFPDAVPILAALAKFGESEVSLSSINNRVSRDLDPGTLEFLVIYKYIAKHCKSNDYFYEILPSGKEILQKLNQ